MTRRADGERRGAVIPMVALVLGVLITFTSFALDLGYQRIARRDMQAVADVVALDLARSVNGRTAAQILADPLWVQSRNESVARNNDTAGVAPTVTAELGLLDTDTGVFTPVGGATVPDAVRVSAGTEVDYFFRPGTGSATRTTVAAADAVACFRLGSFALGVNSGNSALLNALVGDALNLGVLGYSGLATSSISLLGLGTELGVGTVDELAALQNVSVGDFYLAVADVMQANGDTANATLLQSIALGLGPMPPIDIAEVLSLSSGSGSALNTQLNVLDLVAGAAFVANGTNALSVPNLAVNLGVTSLVSSLSIVQAPQMGCGHVNIATARADQLSADITGTLINLPSILGLTATASMDLDVDLAQAVGVLRQIICGDGIAGDPEGIDVQVATALSQLDLRVPVRLVGNLGLVAVEINLLAVATTNPPATTSTAQVRIPPHTYTTPVETGTGTVGLSGLTVQTLNVTVVARLFGVPVALPVPLANILGPVVTTIVNPLIARIDSLLLGPLSALLGLNVAGADVFGVPRPTCTSPVLRG